jgi:hypothetical protein
LDRQGAISKLEEIQKCRLICYATGDRTGQEAQIGADAIPLLYEHLRAIGKVERVGLLIYSNGGHTMSGFALGNALREFSDNVIALVPFRAHSCATLICLAANTIYMGPFGQLSPIDPSITTPHGPRVEEDVAGYLSLAREDAKVAEAQMVEVFGQLAKSINPLALGAVFRSRQQIGMLAKKLLSRHIKDEARVKRVVTALTRDLLSHDYVIGRAEAKEIGLPVEAPPDEAAGLMWEIYLSFVDEMVLGTPWNVEAELGATQGKRATLTRCVIESKGLKHTFETHLDLKRTQILQGGMKLEGVQGRVVEEGWRKR